MQMDNYETDRILAEINRALEDLTYRLFTLEEGLADISAYVETQKEESVDA